MKIDELPDYVRKYFENELQKEYDDEYLDGKYFACTDGDKKYEYKIKLVKEFHFIPMYECSDIPI